MLAFGACGFQPVLAPGGDASRLLGDVAIEVKEGRDDFEFRARLIDRIGDAGSEASYDLRYDLVIEESVVTISDDDSIDRYTLLGSVEFSIIDRTTGIALYQQTARASSGYSATSATYPTRIAARDARLRLSQSLADQVIQLLQLQAGDIVR